MADPRAVLEQSRVVAVVGLSAQPWKAAYAVPAELQACGFRIIPVNPRADELLGEKVHRRLADIGEPVDLVNVFRPSGEAAEVTRQAVEIGAKAVWLQLGIRSPEARRIAEEAGLDYVEDRCIAVDVGRLGIRK